MLWLANQAAGWRLMNVHQKISEIIPSKDIQHDVPSGCSGSSRNHSPLPGHIEEDWRLTKQECKDNPTGISPDIVDQLMLNRFLECTNQIHDEDALVRKLHNLINMTGFVVVLHASSHLPPIGKLFLAHVRDTLMECWLAQTIAGFGQIENTRVNRIKLHKSWCKLCKDSNITWQLSIQEHCKHLSLPGHYWDSRALTRAGLEGVHQHWLWKSAFENLHDFVFVCIFARSHTHHQSFLLLVYQHSQV